MEYDVPLKCVGVMNVIFIVSQPFKLGENPIYVVSLKKNFSIGLYEFRHLQTGFFQTWCDDGDH